MSFFQVRNSKYGGYIGPLIGRYDQKNVPPHVIRTDTCCLRIEFQTGCCDPDSSGFTGFRASYKFVLSKYIFTLIKTVNLTLKYKLNR